MVLAQIDNQVASLGYRTLHIDRGYGRQRATDIETTLAQTALQSVGDLPQFLLILRVFADQVKTLQSTHYHRHREALSVELRTHIVAQQVNQPLVRCNECTDTCHRLSEGVEQNINAIGYAEVRSGTATALTHRTEAVSVINQQTERELALQSHDLVQLTQITLHTEYTLGDNQHAAILRLSQLGSVAQLQAQAVHIVMTKYETLALVHTQTVDDTSVSLSVINHNVAGSQQTVDDRHHTLITEVEQECVLLTNESGQLALQLLVINGLTAHHTCTHRSSHTEVDSALSVSLAHLGVVSQTEVVVQAPVQNLLTAELHMRADRAFEFREREIAVRILLIHTDRTTGTLLQAFKNISHCFYNLKV